MHPAIWQQQVWAENWGAVPLWGKGELGPHLTECGQLGAEAYMHAKFHLHPFNCFATIHQRYR